MSDSEAMNNQTPSPNHEQPPQEEKSFLRIIVHSFFIIPFLIAVFCALLFTGIHLLTREQRTVYDYLEDVKTGGQTKRWQGAFELSRILANPELIPNDDRFARELISAFEQSKHDDNRTRQYLALAMGKTGNRQYTQTLIDALDDEKEANISSLLYALGMLKDQEASATVQPYTEHPDNRIRSIAVVALGNIADPDSKNILKNRLNDSEPNVQWGAAISLAQMADPSGKSIIRQMLNRQYWTQFPEVDPDEQNNLVLTAIIASKKLNDPELNSQIQELAQSDPNMKIRAAAQDSLNQ